MAPQRSAALVAACLLASRPQLAEPSRPKLMGQALDAAGSSGVPHCKALVVRWVVEGGIPQSDGQKLTTNGVSCLSPCSHWCDAMLGGHQDFAALRSVAASFAISSQGPADSCAMGWKKREQCLLQVDAAGLAAVNAELKKRLGAGRHQNKLVGDLKDEIVAIGQWGSRVKLYTCFGGTDQLDLNIAGEGSFLLGGAGKRYMPETAGAIRSFIQQYAGAGACHGSCDYERKMFTGMQ